MTTTRQFDFLNRLQSIASVPSGSGQLPLAYGYQYNHANQRTRRTETDSSFWAYQYDALGQVIGGKKFWSDGAPVAGQQFEYGFDDIGNRNATKAGGDSAGANLRSASYTANALNQYTSRTVPGAFDVLGLADAPATVSVNGSSSGVCERGQYFRKEVSVSNGSAPVWQGVTVTTSTGGSNPTGYVFVPPATGSFAPDLDGNLLSDGRFNYTWDAENRLTKVESLASAPAASKRRVTWEYDYRGRRIRQTTYDGNTGSYVVTEDLKFLSDGWRHAAELNASNNALLRSYAWGLDLSGSLDGAGGVGGLLWVNSAANGLHFAAYDANGNVAGLVKGTDGTITAWYEYGPFGEPLRVAGAMAKENPFRFSTKRANDTSDLVLYEYRVYSASTGRWPNRDPIGEAGGVNLYGFVVNNPLAYVDPLGNAAAPAAPAPADGTLTIKVLQAAKALSDCGSAEYRVQWQVSGSVDGWVLQHVKWEAKVKDCKGNKVTAKNPDGLEFTEGWQVAGGDVFIGFKDRSGSNKHQADTFRTMDEGTGRKGTIKITGKVKFMKDYNLTTPPWGYTVPEARSLPTTKPTASGWDDAGAQDHTMTVEFDCCCAPIKKTTATSSPWKCFF